MPLNEQTPDWSAIDTVLLDMDGTILDLSFDNYFWIEFMPQVYADKNGMTLEESQKFLWESYHGLEGTLQWYCLDYWSERLDLDIVQLKYSVRDRVSFRHGAVAFLEFLVAQKKRVILVTNAHRKSLEIKLLNAEFHQYFDHLNSSHDFGYPKEDQRYWHKLEETFQFDPKRALFVDDSLRILKSAQDYGIGHLRGICLPDRNKPIQDCSPFIGISDYHAVIQGA